MGVYHLLPSTNLKKLIGTKLSIERILGYTKTSEMFIVIDFQKRNSL